MNQSDNIISKRFTDRERLRIISYFVSALCILAVSLTFFTLSIGKPYMGIKLSMNDGVWIVAIEDNNGQASQAGIREGDRTLEINGQPAEVFLEKYENAGIVLGRLIQELTVVDNHGQLKSVALKDSSVSWQNVTAQIMWLFVCLIFWIIGFYVFLKRPKSAAALLLSLCGLALGLALSANMAAERVIPSAPWFEVAASVTGPWLLLHFFLVLPEERTKLRNSRLVYLIYLPAVITLALLPFIGYADGQPLPWFRNIRLFEFGVVFLAVAGVAVLNYFRAVSPRTRQQMKIVSIGCIAALFPFLILGPLPEAIRGQTIIPSGYTVLFFTFIPLSMGYAVVLQKLMDIDIIIRRGVIYGLITVVMAAILSTAIFCTLTFQDSLNIPEEILITLVSGGVATVLFGPTKQWLENLVDKYLYKDRYDYRQTIQSLTLSLNSVKDLTGISRLIVGTLVSTLNLAGGCLFLKIKSDFFELSAAQGTFTDKGRQEQLATCLSQRNHMIEFPNSASAVCSDLAFLIPLVVGEEEIGILCLSQKVSRQDFSSNDIYLLQEIASVAAIELHSAMLICDVSIRDTFISVASHELRTPLTSIVGYADLLLRQDPPEVNRRRWLKNILDNGQRVSAIVDDLLNVNRIQSGKVNIKRERVKLFDILEETLSFVRESDNKHKFVIDMEPNLPDVLGDRDKFGEVVGNLISNAVKYSPKGGRITLSAYSDYERHQVIVSVIDQGIGIGPADKESLFTTFHRIKRPETQGIRGSGLGLYIAKEWTEAMGGKIWLESKLNKGSTFFISIPTWDSDDTVVKKFTNMEE
jgi:signal transduction histidine kinase